MIMTVNKIISSVLLLIVGVFIATFFNTTYVDAETLTLNDVVAKLKQSATYNDYNKGQYNTTISLVNGSINITYKYTDSSDTTLSTEVVTTFTSSNDILTYNIPVNKNDDSVPARSIIDGMWIYEITKIVAEANGYTEDQLKSIEDQSKFNLEDNGIEITTFDYSYSQDGATMTGEATETFKIDINFLDLEINEIENPKTGLDSPNFVILLSFVVVGSLGLLYLRKLPLFKKL